VNFTLLDPAMRTIYRPPSPDRRAVLACTLRRLCDGANSIDVLHDASPTGPLSAMTICRRLIAVLILTAQLAGCSAVLSATGPGHGPTSPDSNTSARGSSETLPELRAALPGAGGGLPHRAATSRSYGSEITSRSVQTGYASWYGEPHHGRQTASGERYDMHELTAAHPTLPMGTRLVVTNLNNGRSAAVRVNDRGPVVDGRIVDLSYAAARRLAAIGDGVVPVRVRVVSVPSP
jgi:rare lipoprotein A